MASPCPAHELHPLWGKEKIARKCADYLTTVFQCIEEAECSKKSPLPRFIAQLIHNTNLPDTVACSALILLQRLPTTIRQGLAQKHGHSIFLAAFILAAQQRPWHGLDAYSTSHWCQMSKFKANDINLMQAMLRDLLHERVKVHPTDFTSFYRKLARYKPERYRAPPPEPLYTISEDVHNSTKSPTLPGSRSNSSSSISTTFSQISDELWPDPAFMVEYTTRSTFGFITSRIASLLQAIFSISYLRR